MKIADSPFRAGAAHALARKVEKAIPSGIVRFLANDRNAWLALRERDVTASVAAALIGEHPYMTRLGLYALKTGQGPDTEVEPKIEENHISLPPMLRGTILEPVVPKILGMLRPTWQVERCEHYYRDPAVRLGATPDLFAFDPARPKGFGIVQVKTADHFTFKKVWQGDDGEVLPPDFILVQAIIEASLTGAAWAEVAVMVSGSTLDLWLISIPSVAMAGIVARLRRETAEFWRRIAAGEMPEADYGRDAEVLAALYRDDNGQEIDLRADNRLPTLLEDRDLLLAQRRDIDARLDVIDTELKAKLGPYEAALAAGNRRITWRSQRRAAHFQFPSESRVLRVSAAR